MKFCQISALSAICSVFFSSKGIKLGVSHTWKVLTRMSLSLGFYRNTQKGNAVSLTQHKTRCVLKKKKKKKKTLHQGASNRSSVLEDRVNKTRG
jgi:hypothetical protein